MAFGSQAKRPVNRPVQADRPNIFFDTKAGIRVFRIVPGDEVRFKQLFFARESDGSWIPTFSYIKNDPRKKTSVIIGVFDATLGAIGEDGNPVGQWVYGGDYGASPVDRWVANADVDEETRQKMYASEKFYLNVLDRTPVKLLPDGTYAYPDTRNKYPAGSESIAARPLNEIRILHGSSGKPRDENGEVIGKHLYARLLRTVDSQLDVAGNVMKPSQYDLRLVTSGKDLDTDRSFSATGNQDVVDWSVYQMYNLRAWVKPWSYAAIQDLMDGADVAEVVKAHDIQMYPDKVDIAIDEEDEEGLFN